MLFAGVVFGFFVVNTVAVLILAKAIADRRRDLEPASSPGWPPPPTSDTNERSHTVDCEDDRPTIAMPALGASIDSGATTVMPTYDGGHRSQTLAEIEKATVKVPPEEQLRDMMLLLERT